MKKTVKFSIITLCSLLLVSTLFAQDSTYVKIANDFLSPLEVKYPWIISVLAVLAVLSEVLAYIPSLKANSVVQLVVNWIKALSAPQKP